MLLPHWSGLLTYLLSKLNPLGQTPGDTCFASTHTLGSLVECLEKYTVPEDYYDQFSYLEAQPTDSQREAWFAAVTTLLSTHNNCSSAIVPTALHNIYSATSFTDINGQSFCILYERSVSPCSMRYEKGWGFMVVPSSRDMVSRLLHLSAPHPFYDVGTPIQATHLFKETGAKSLLVPGRMRPAYNAPSTCVLPRSNKSTYYMTDPAHNDLEPFFDANRAIWEWQTRHGGCPSLSCAFIQFHGKARTTCPKDDIFLSAGLADDTWYTDDVDRPIKRLRNQLYVAFNSESSTTAPLTISLPSDSKCILTATKNVVGRYLNSYPLSSSHEVCTQSSDPDSTQGVFIHIEQAAVARNKAAREGWIRALKNTFVGVDAKTRARL
ncbi:hypothetical protein P691DRAFT_793566 [Macrolepiota fuliginosa MF-IS2]|uniref:Uncharacterized protein n=1 Tax=Macrolepiota fuliginosa MF-IS2 TaxID=1400762 RepID=A0A9P5XDN1_9AGAR|nr:hypothetical protein P691DRAFT_793566 [Macrolepiota fuliginosa MF-IS2]